MQASTGDVSEKLIYPIIHVIKKMTERPSADFVL